MANRAIILVLDGVGIGEAPDTAAYGDAGSHTLGNVAKAVGGLALPHLRHAGLGNIAPLKGMAPVDHPTAAYGLMEPKSAGKDSTTGHWEIAGVHLAQPFPTYPRGFPPEVVAEFARRTGRPVIGNVVGSGTAIIETYADEHVRTGAWILYTSADSVFQIAAHEGTIPLDELYAGCQIARDMLVAPHDVSRVIARPFVGAPGAWKRTANRKDISIQPPAETLLDALAAAGIPRSGVGKVDDLFAGRGITSIHTPTNQDAYALIEGGLLAMRRGLLFANVIEFDQSWGHRNDVAGFQKGLLELDRWIPRLLKQVREEDLIIFTADHGNDPTTPSTDHARECVPVLALGPRVRPVALGELGTFADVGQTIAEFLGVRPLEAGTSFLERVWS